MGRRDWVCLCGFSLVPLSRTHANPGTRRIARRDYPEAGGWGRAVTVPCTGRGVLATSSAGRQQGSESLGRLRCLSAAPAWLRVATSSGCPKPSVARVALVLPVAVLGRMGPSPSQALLLGLLATAGGPRGQAALAPPAPGPSRAPRGNASPGQGGHPWASGSCQHLRTRVALWAPPANPHHGAGPALATSVVVQGQSLSLGSSPSYQRGVRGEHR